jgi:hypothetical protein
MLQNRFGSFLRHVASLLVLAEADEPRVAEMVVWYPFDELDLRGQHGAGDIGSSVAFS